MDETFLFTNINKNVQDNLYRSKMPDVKLDAYLKNYEAYNMQAERDFKLEVLDWLNNGEPKLFRSAAEGNYIVRLINTSLSPNDQLARRLHTFSSTACEIDEVNFEKLKFYNLIPEINITKKSIGWMTKDFNQEGYEVNENGESENLLKYKAIAFKLEEMIPGDKVYINDGIERNGIMGYTISIGATGSYNIDLDKQMTITEIKIKSNDVRSVGKVKRPGSLTYAYNITTFNKFDTIKKFEIIDVPAQQFFGPTTEEDGNIFNQINTIKESIQKIYYIHATLLPREKWEKFSYPDDTSFFIDDQQIDLSETIDFLLLNLDNIPKIKKLGKKIMIEIGYQKIKYVYEIESDIGDYDSLLQVDGNESEPSADDIVQIKNNCQNFLNILEEKLKEQELIKGELV